MTESRISMAEYSVTSVCMN